MRRRLATISVVALTLTGTAACGSDSEPTTASEESGAELDGLTVTGDFGKKPTVKTDGFDVKAGASEELIEGDGAEVTQDSLVMYHVLIANGTDGKELQSSYEQPTSQQMIVADQPALISDAVVGAHIGSRVAVAAPVEELVGKGGAAQVGLTAKDDIVLVFDLVEEGEAPLTAPEGEEVDPPADAPKVVGDDQSVTGLDFSDAPAKAPKADSDFEVIPLVNGEGAEVQENQTVTVNYFGAVWGNEDEPFDSSFARGEPASFQLTKGGLIDGWVKGLQGVKVGSRVMLVIPPSLGYGAEGSGEKIPGDSTLVFVIDVLGASG
jgi:peptidylprolyl isomerase